jgi:cytochrome c oxidase subunit II
MNEPGFASAGGMGDTRTVMRGWLRKALVLLPLLAIALAGCASDAPQDTFKPEGEHAKNIDNLIIPVFAIAGVVFVAILGACLFIAIKFRARDDDDFDDMPKQIHGNVRAEIGWTIIPALILIGVAIPTVIGVFKLNEDPPKSALRVEVIGQQWWWEYRYDLDNDGQFDDLVTANDLVMPVDREIALTITSRDVIHSFWVPRLNGKRDAVPNRLHPWKLQADEPGEYVGQCTEYCGLSHAEMRIKAVVLSKQDFAAWEQGQARKADTYEDDDNSLEAQGYRLFVGQLCSSCHLIDGVNNDKFVKGKGVESGRIKDPSLQQSRHAPNLTHLMSRTTFAGAKFNLRKDNDECTALGETWADTEEGVATCLDRSALEAWIRNPPAQKAMAVEGVPGRSVTRGMPNLELTEDQIDLLVTYLTTLK